MTVRKLFAGVAAVALIAMNAQAQAGSVVIGGSDLLAGNGYSSAQIAAQANAGNTINARGLTGISLWSFLSGATGGAATSVAGGMSKTYGSIVTFNPTGANTNPNFDLRYYVVGTGSSGSKSVASLGQIDPAFTGPNTSST